MLLVAIGANLSAEGFASPLATCEAAVARLAAEPGIVVEGRSHWYESEPVPPSDQPWYVNGVLRLATDLDPCSLLTRLHALEATFGRVRRARNEARPPELDPQAYDRVVRQAGGGPLPPPPPPPRPEEAQDGEHEEK